MSWFKIDDLLHSHRKARRVRRSHPSKGRDVAPFGLWTLAGSWCGQNPTEGFIPLEVLEEWDDDAQDLAERLVDADLWERAELDGEPGYIFHDWADHNPASGESQSQAGKRGNHVRWHEKAGRVDPDCEFCSPPSSPAIAPDVAPDRGPESPRPVPSRPDPTEKRPAAGAAAAFDEFWKLYPRKVGKQDARKVWGRKVRDTDPAAILAGLRRYLPVWATLEQQFIPHPSTWLQRGSWEDEVTVDDGQATLPDYWRRGAGA